MKELRSEWLHGILQLYDILQKEKLQEGNQVQTNGVWNHWMGTRVILKGVAHGNLEAGGWVQGGEQNSSLWIHGDKYMTPHIYKSFRYIHHKNKQPLLHITRNSTRKRIKMEHRLYKKEKKNEGHC